MWGWNEGTRGASEAQCSAARAQTQILVCASGHGTWSSDIPVSSTGFGKPSFRTSLPGRNGLWGHPAYHGLLLTHRNGAGGFRSHSSRLTWGRSWWERPSAPMKCIACFSV